MGHRSTRTLQRQAGAMGRHDMESRAQVTPPSRVEVDRIAQLLTELRFPPATITAYLSVLSSGAVDFDHLVTQHGLDQVLAGHAMEQLLLLQLVSYDFVRDKRVFFALDPQIAWKALDTDLVWRSETLIVADTQSGGQPSRRGAAYAELAGLCGIQYECAATRHNPLGHKHRDLAEPRQFAAWLAHAVSIASQTVIAVELPPRLPELAPFWVALTRRLRAGVIYKRIISPGEIVEHGLDIVARDIREHAIDLRLMSFSQIRDAFYVIDGKYVLLKNLRELLNQRGDRPFGRLTTHDRIVKRYIMKFNEHYYPRSVSASAAIKNLQVVASTHRAALSDVDPQVRLLFDRIVGMGKFARGIDAPMQHVAELLDRGVVSRNDAGFITMRVADLDRTCGIVN
jgi:hypothetical protein